MDVKLTSHLYQIQSTSAPAKPANKLDNMLGNLQSDLNKLGVQTNAKGVCGACKKPIAGQVMTENLPDCIQAMSSHEPFTSVVISKDT